MIRSASKGWCVKCAATVQLPCKLCALRQKQANQEIRQPRPIDPRLDEDLREKLASNVAELDLPVRVINCLQNSDYYTLNDLVHATRDELLKIPTFANKTVNRIIAQVKSILD